MTDYKNAGLFHKYRIARKDGAPLDQGERHFCLRYDKDDTWGRTCRVTLREFAERIRAQGYSTLADDLTKSLDEAEQRLSDAPSPSSTE